MFQYKLESTNQTSEKWYLSTIDACDAAYNEIVTNDLTGWFTIVSVKV